MNAVTKIELVVQKVAQYAETITTAAAAAVAGFDPSVLPVKWAAGYAAVAGATRVAREYVNKGVADLPAIESEINKFPGFSKAVELPAPDVADPNAKVPVPPLVRTAPAIVANDPAGPTGVPVAPVQASPIPTA